MCYCTISGSLKLSCVWPRAAQPSSAAAFQIPSQIKALGLCTECEAMSSRMSGLQDAVDLLEA